MSVTDPLLEEPTRPLRRVEYDQLVEAGVFEGEPIELLDGRLVVMSPQGTRHAAVIGLLTELLVPALSGRALVRVQCPLAVSELSEPEPDFAVVERRDYSSAHPTTALLAVEVAESSLRKDRDFKPALYAQAGVGEYWLVDVVGQSVTVQRQPAGARYRQARPYRRGEAITLTAFPDVTLEVDAFLPHP